MRINDGRSLFGAASLVITGVVLGIIAYPYYQFGEVGEPVKRGRWVWEILMNLQVLCLAFMWHCYTDKIKKSAGKRAVLMRVRMLFGLVAVLLPFVVIMTSVAVGWFNQRPPVMDTVRYTYFFSGVGLMCVLIPRLVLLLLRPEAGRRAKQWPQSQRIGVLRMMPSAVALVLAILALLLNQYALIIWLPPLFYLQASVPYFMSGLRFQSDPIS